jgi:hypothetical protein
LFLKTRIVFDDVITRKLLPVADGIKYESWNLLRHYGLFFMGNLSCLLEDDPGYPCPGDHCSPYRLGIHFCVACCVVAKRLATAKARLHEAKSSVSFQLLQFSYLAYCATAKIQV